MSITFVVITIVGAALLSLFFSTLTYSLREFSRSRLDEALESRGKKNYLARTINYSSDLVVVTAIGRLLANILILIGVLHLVGFTPYARSTQYVLAALGTAVIHLFLSVGIPHALSRHAAEPIIATFVEFLHGLRVALTPLGKIVHALDLVVEKAATTGDSQEPEKIEQEIENEILSAVEEGEKEGVVHEEEREMIERVIAFHDAQVGQIMTPRPDIFAIEVGSGLEMVKATIAESGHSRIPVYQETIDQIVGILYARDLLRFLGEPAERFNIHEYMRPAFFVPETKPLPDLLHDFRLQKVHIAIVGDEYGGIAGLVTIEDLVEELIGDISDEHEPAEPAMIARLNELVAEADARVYLDELNRVMGLNLPEEAGYDTLGGFVVNTLGRIPTVGTSFDFAGTKYTILDAEPQKVNRVRIELAAQAVAEETSKPAG
jgi:CBS domain containing-hemolysin-like protein